MAAIAFPRYDERNVAPPVLWLVIPVELKRRPSPRVMRRRRQLAAVLVALLIAGVAVISGVAQAGVSWLGSGSPATPQPGASVGGPVGGVRPIVHTVHIVEPGETAWSVARSWQGHGDIRPLVDRLVAQEHGHPLQPGDRLVLR